MRSEEHLLMTYQNHISFKAQVTNRNDRKICYQAIGVITAGILPLEVVAMYGGNIIGILISFVVRDLYGDTPIASGSNGEECLSAALHFLMALGSARFYNDTMPSS